MSPDEAAKRRTRPNCLTVMAEEQRQVALWLRGFSEKHPGLSLRIIVHRGGDISIYPAPKIKDWQRREAGQIYSACWQALRACWERVGLPLGLFGGKAPQRLAELLEARGELPKDSRRSVH